MLLSREVNGLTLEPLVKENNVVLILVYMYAPVNINSTYKGANWPVKFFTSVMLVKMDLLAFNICRHWRWRQMAACLYGLIVP